MAIDLFPRAGLKVRNPYWMSTHCCGKRENMVYELAFRHSSLKISFRELRFNHFYNRISDLVRHSHPLCAGWPGRHIPQLRFHIFTQNGFCFEGKARPLNMERSRHQGSSETSTPRIHFPRVDPLFIFHVCTPIIRNRILQFRLL